MGKWAEQGGNETQVDHGEKVKRGGDGEGMGRRVGETETAEGARNVACGVRRRSGADLQRRGCGRVSM